MEKKNLRKLEKKKGKSGKPNRAAFPTVKECAFRWLTRERERDAQQFHKGEWWEKALANERTTNVVEVHSNLIFFFLSFFPTWAERAGFPSSPLSLSSYLCV